MNKNLKMALLEAGLSQVHFAKLLNLSEAQMCRYCTGRSNPPKDMQEKIATILAKPTVELFPRGGAR